MSQDTIERILTFWFGRIPDSHFGVRDNFLTLTRVPYWHGHTYRKFMDVDGTVRTLFAQDIENAARGLYDDWKATLLGRLAFIVLCDQFPRNAHRGTPKAFELDEVSFELALRALELGDDRKFHPLVRSFYYLPLVHVEDLEIQERSVALFRAALKDASWPVAKYLLAMQHLGAKRHRDIIHRFQRFPHRNSILGRSSTLQELQFLKEPNSSF